MALRKARISSVGHSAPDHVLSNADLEKLVDTNDEWIRTRTGIRERRILKDPEKATAYMSAIAAREALEHAGVTACATMVLDEVLSPRAVDALLAG
jgi:3-oxoacyl-[acyl-carrier-protein] synthase III